MLTLVAVYLTIGMSFFVITCAKAPPRTWTEGVLSFLAITLLWGPIMAIATIMEFPED